METAAPSTGQVAGSGAPGVLPSVRRDDRRSERLWRGLRDDNSSIDQSPVMLSHRSDPETSSEPLSRSSPGLAVVPDQDDRGGELKVRGGDQRGVGLFGEAAPLTGPAAVHQDPVEQPAPGAGPVTHQP